jgi:hypothetical protein
VNAARRSLPKTVVDMLKKAGKDKIARRVLLLDIHDDNLISAKISPPRTKRNNATIEFELEDDGTGKTKILTFVGCSNLCFVMDFDVLASNWFAQTRMATCTSARAKMTKFAKPRQILWGTRCMPPYHPKAPILEKLSDIHKYHLFTIKFFGGRVDILARNFQLKMK